MHNAKDGGKAIYVEEKETKMWFYNSLRGKRLFNDKITLCQECQQRLKAATPK